MALLEHTQDFAVFVCTCNMSRTNLEINDQLIRRALRVAGLKTKRAVSGTRREQAATPDRGRRTPGSGRDDCDGNPARALLETPNVSRTIFRNGASWNRTVLVRMLTLRAYSGSHDQKMEPSQPWTPGLPLWQLTTASGSSP